MARNGRTSPATRQVPYSVEIVGPMKSGQFAGRVLCGGDAIGFTGNSFTAEAVQAAGLEVVEGHRAGARVVELDPERAAAEAKQEEERRRRLAAEQAERKRANTLTAEQVAEKNVETIARMEQRQVQEDARREEALRRFAKEENERNGRPPRRPAERVVG